MRGAVAHKHRKVFRSLASPLSRFKKRGFGADARNATYDCLQRYTKPEAVWGGDLHSPQNALDSAATDFAILNTGRVVKPSEPGAANPVRWLTLIPDQGRHGGVALHRNIDATVLTLPFGKSFQTSKKHASSDNHNMVGVKVTLPT